MSLFQPTKCFVQKAKIQEKSKTGEKWNVFYNIYIIYCNRKQISLRAITWQILELSTTFEFHPE